MADYNEQEVLATQEAIRRTYQAAGVPFSPFDDASVVWSNRTTYDATAGGMGWAASREKHLAELRAALGSQPAPGPQPPSPDPPAGEGDALAGRLRGEDGGGGPRLVDDLGPYRWACVTAFDALHLASLGEWDRLARYATWTRGVGGTGWRVFLNWKVTGFDFRSTPGYFALLQRLCTFTRDQSLRLQGVAICDQIPGGLAAQQDFLDQAFGVLSRFDHAVGECANEPYNGNSELPTLFRRTSAWGNLLVARGMCRPDANPAEPDPHNRPYLPSLGWTSYETGRSEDWYRKVGKDGMEIRNGVLSSADGSHDAVINNEPMGAAEAYQPGRRSNRPDEFFLAGCAASFFTSGVTGHGDSQTMQLCTVPGPIETACIRQLFRGVRIVPFEAPVWEYARYGPSHPPAPMPVEPDPLDGDESRIHSKVGPTEAVSLNYRFLLPGHEAWRPQGVNGWRTVLQDGPYVRSVRG